MRKFLKKKKFLFQKFGNLHEIMKNHKKVHFGQMKSYKTYFNNILEDFE